jgi:mono/diheme cytochrome c family protein
MYIVDMYHGIIQEGEWTPEGSYLRAKIEQYQLDKVIGLGRVWRLTHEDTERDKTQPKMYDQTSQELLSHLAHPNGWWRDMAQQVLVQRRDKSVAPALINIVKTSDNILAKFHALWVLEGIGSLEPSLVRELMKDENPRMRIMALWVSETLYKAGDKSFATQYLQLMSDEDTNVKMRAMMTGRLLKIPGTNDKVKQEIAKDKAAGVQLVGNQVLNPPSVNSFFGRSNPNFSKEEQALVNKGAEIFSSLCATCHGPLGIGTPAGPGKLLAPSLVGSSRIQLHPDYIVKTLLHGMTGEIQGESYAGVMMAPMKSNSDEWIAAVASFVRANFENEASPVTPEDVAKIRKETANQTTMYKFDELWSSIPKLLEPNEQWKMTASHTAEVRKGSTASPRAALTFEGWTTGISQQKGMWFQVELPQLATISEIQFKSPPISRGWREGSPPPIQTCPRGYNLEISSDGNTWTTIVSEGAGSGSNNRIRFDPVKAKFVRITLTKSEEVVHGERRGQPFDFEVTWNMRELKVYGFL